MFHVDAANEPFIGEELTDYFGDMEHEYWKLVREYARLIVKDMKDMEEPTEWSRDWSKMEWQEINEKLEALENMAPEEKAQTDIVNITLHFFLKDVRPMLPLVTKHNTAVA